MTLWQAQQLLAGRTSGFKVDRYLLLDLIGQGGMGRVYLARDTRLNRRVALKILAPERVNNPRAVARFQREARVGAQLQHENLVRIYDFGEANGRYFLVMEFIEGKTIGHLISEQGPMPPATASRLVRQVAMGLGHAHSKGLIHRDVNPYNIMVTDDGTAKLADLGLAIDLTEGDRVTREGATVGTFDYVAPEQARHSHSADIRSDIYSLGCTLYHMLTGQVPFPSPSLPEKLFAHQAMEPTPLEQLVPGLPEGFAEIVRKMMRKSPDERYATPAQVVQALEPYLDEPAGYGPRPELAAAVPRPGAEASPQPDEPHGPPSAVTTPASGSPQPEDAGSVAVLRAATEPAAATPRSAWPSPSAHHELPRVRPNPRSAPTSGADLDDPSDPPPHPDRRSRGGGPEWLLARRSRPRPPAERTARTVQASIFDAAPRLTPWRTPSSTSRDRTPRRQRSDGSVWWPPIGVLWGLIGVAVVATVLVVILGLAGGLRSSRLPSRGNRGQDGTGPTSRSRRMSRPSSSATITRRRMAMRRGPRPRTCTRRCETSIGLGYVELRNREPLQLEAGKLEKLVSASGRLDIRAAPGVVPVLEIQMGGGKPFLTTGSSVALFLTGLEIRVRYPERTRGCPGQEPGGDLRRPAGDPGRRLRPSRAVRLPGRRRAGPDGCRAMTVDGTKLTVDRCWFQGFDKAIQVNAFNGSLAEIRQTMIVARPPTATDWYGWGVEVQLMQGGKGHPRRLVLEDCTFEGAGLLDLVPEPAHYLSMSS